MQARSAHPQPSYGIHWAGGVAFLLQRAGITNALGVDIPAPFKIHDRAHCPHHIVLEQAPRHPQQDDPLFQAMSPLPGNGVFMTRARPDLVQLLTRLCSPTEDLCTPLWYLQLNQIKARLKQTNCAPVVLTGVRMQDIAMIEKIVDLAPAGHRRIILVVEDWFPVLRGVTTLETQISEIIAPHTLYASGASMLMEYMLEPANSRGAA